MSKPSYFNLIWMSGPPEAVEKNSYTHGPAPWNKFCNDPGDVIIGKNRMGETVICENWDGSPYPLPKSHKKAANFGEV